jgi:IS30 family transposase
MTHSKYIYRKISYTKRLDLASYFEMGLSHRAIEKLGLMSRNSILREKKRCAGKYNADEAQQDAEKKAQKKIEDGMKTRAEMGKRIDELERRISKLENPSRWEITYL